MIPYIIHFIWIDEDESHSLCEIPKFNQFCIKSVLMKNPNADAIIHVNKNLDVSSLRGILKPALASRIKVSIIPSNVFDEINKIGITHVSHKSDYVRYLVLSTVGGIYCDTDVIALKSFKDLLQNNELVVAKQSPAVICSGVIMAKPNHKVITETLEMYHKDYRPDDWAFNAMKVLKANINTYDHSTVLREKDGFHYPNYVRIDELLSWSATDKAPSNLYTHHIFTFSKGDQRIVDDVLDYPTWINNPRNYIEKLMKEIIEF